MLKKVLILSASAGAGHVRAAQALEKAFNESGLAQTVKHVDTLQYTNALFRKLYADSYIELVNRAPAMLGWLYDRLDKPWKNEKLTHAINKLNTGPFVRMLHEEAPDVTVCTHFLPGDIISRLKAKQKLRCPLAVAVTDMDVHATWLARACDHYFVAIAESAVFLEKVGVPADRISVTGIPIDPVFAIKKDLAEMRIKHGLKPGVTTLLVSAGGFGVGPVEALIAGLGELKQPLQVIAVCGKNAQLKARVQKQAAALEKNGGPVRFTIMGFTTEMDELMSAADILVGKSGGLTTSEALAKGLAMVVVNPIPGQEERNSDHLLEEGVAIRCNNPLTMPYKIAALLDNPKRIAGMKAAAKRMGRPEAARRIAEKAASLAG
jgi:processive 1,2-diacylglycerol beta-glucosyltransferase